MRSIETQMLEKDNESRLKCYDSNQINFLQDTLDSDFQKIKHLNFYNFCLIICIIIFFIYLIIFDFSWQSVIIYLILFVGCFCLSIILKRHYYY